MAVGYVILYTNPICIKMICLPSWDSLVDAILLVCPFMIKNRVRTTDAFLNVPAIDLVQEAFYLCAFLAV